MNIKLTTDSACDLTQELIQRFGVSGVIPMTVILGDEERADGTFDPADIYDFHKRTKTLPTTSAVNPYAFETFFSEQTADGSAVVHFSLSSKMSATYENAMAAARQFSNVYIVDGKQVSAGTAMLLFRARDILNTSPDIGAKDLYERIEGMTGKVQTAYCLDTITYLYENGRCNALGLLGANLLALHPSIHVKDGENTVGKKYRGKLSSAIPKFIEDVVRDNPDYDDTRCCVVCSAGTDPDIFSAALDLTKEKFNFKEVFSFTLGSTMTCHCGKGTLGMTFMNK